jgi:SAM-dependent methyltransferase
MNMNSAHLEFCASPEWRTIVEEMILPDALRNVKMGTEVIEIGPGPGFTTDVLRKLTDHLIAVEVDPNLAVALKTRLQGTNVEVVCGDATSLDFPDGRFSAAASFHMLHHIASEDGQNRTLAELARVLRPGGLLVAADGCFSEGSLAFHENDIYNPIDPESLRHRLELVGFVSVNVALHDLGWFCSAVVA